MEQLNTLKQKTNELNTELYAYYLAYRDVRVNWSVRLLLAFIIGYAISPIDLIPDLTPVFGYLDDVLLIGAGLSISYNLISKDVLGQARLKAYEDLNTRSEEMAPAYRIVGYVWLLAASLAVVFLYKLFYVPAF